MKKSMLLIALLVFVPAISFSQQVTGIVKGSLNLSTYNGSDADNTKTLVGGRIGLGIEYPLSDIVSLQPTLYLSHKGAKADTGEDNVEAKINEWYLDLPIDVQLRFNVGSNTNFVVAAGPYISYGAFGKVKASASNSGYTVTAETNTFGNDSGLRRFDGGLNFEAGLEFGKVLVGGSYEWGLNKLNKDVKVYNSNFSINVGYKF